MSLLWKPELLVRRRVNDILSKILDVPLFVLISSIGYGKSTAVKQFLAKREELQSVWFTVGRGEHDEHWLWHKFSQCFHGICPKLSRQLATYGLPSCSSDRDRVIDMMQDAYAFTKPTIVVVDDYHEYATETMNLFFQAVAASSIANLHIMLISRSISGFPLEELTLKNQCLVLAQNIFQFTHEETVQFFKLNGFALSPTEEKYLIELTDGWTAAIYLSLVSYAEKQTLGDVQDIMRLVRSAIYEKLDCAEQRSLQMLSVVDGFTLDEAVFLTGQKCAARLISVLAQNDCFVRYDYTSERYYLHAIFRKMLSELLVFSDIDEETLFARCGDWCVERGDYIRAVEFYHKAECFEKILCIFERPGSAQLFHQAPSIIGGAFNDMALSLKLSHPIAYITYIYVYLFVVDAAEGAKMLYEAKAFYEQSNDTLDKERVLGEISLIESIMKFNDIRAIRRFAKQAYDHLGGSPSQVVHSQSIFTLGSPHSLYLYHRNKGELASLVIDIEETYTTFCHMLNASGTGLEYLARAEYSLETGDLREAELLANKAVFKARTQSQLSIEICAHMCLARLAILTGNPQNALTIVDSVREEVEADGRPILLNSCDIFAGYIYGILGKNKSIPLWLQNNDTSSSNLFRQGAGIILVVSGCSAILRKSYAELEIIVETMKALYKPRNHIFGYIYAHIYEAIAKKHLQKLDHARQALGAAIELAVSDGIVTPFAEYMPELISMWPEIGLDTEWNSKVISLGKRFMGARDKSNSESLTLTNREIEILHALSNGNTQSQIAEKLHISQNTVKRHLQNIYEKLGVPNKTLAIKTAKELRIL